MSMLIAGGWLCKGSIEERGALKLLKNAILDKHLAISEKLCDANEEDVC